MFALADKLFQAGALSRASEVLETLTQDKHAELRAEARFRLAALREKMGDLPGAARALQDLLAEQPAANPARLELARILSRMGKTDEARTQARLAEAIGLPPEVEQSVRRFANSLVPARRRGISIELASGPDSNINHATASQYIDTIIAPFELDPDARRQSGIGFSVSGQAWSSNAIGGTDLLSRISGRADLFDKARFNDIQVGLDSGPQWSSKLGTVRPSLTASRRWFGGRGYALEAGAALDWTVPIGRRSQIGLGASRVHQKIDRNRFQDGWRNALNLSLYQSIGAATSARATLRWAGLDARVRPESLRQWGMDLLVARRWAGFSLFAQAGYTRTRGRAPLFLFGEKRRDRRVDLTGGIVLNRLKLGGFSPLIRLNYTASSADIVLYDYRRTRLDIGFARSF